MNLSTVLEDHTCRSCTRITKDVPPLLLAENSKLTQLGEEFQFCLFEFNIDDNMPMRICHYCKFQLGFFSEFKKVAINAHQDYLKIMLDRKSEDIQKKTSNDYDIDDNEGYTYVEYLEDEQNSNILQTPNYKLECEDNEDNDGVIDTNDYDSKSVRIEYYDKMYLNEEADELNEIEEQSDNRIKFKTNDYGNKRRRISRDARIDDYDDVDNEDHNNLCVVYVERQSENSFAYSTKGTSIKEIKPNFKQSAFIPVECHFCGIKLTSKRKYNIHVKQHLGISRKTKNIKHVCEQCDIEFPSKKMLSIHNREHKVRCDDCSKRFNSIEALTDHQKDECTKLKYACRTCSRVFKNPSTLLIHEHRHTNIRPYPCELCDKCFKTKSDLGIHIGVHRNIRKYVCEVCGKAFRAHSHMRNHLETHTNNQYRCDVCNHLFKTKVSILQHLRTIHVNPNAFKCDFCNKSYGMKTRLKRHQEVAHKILFEVEDIEEDDISMYTLI